MSRATDERVLQEAIAKHQACVDGVYAAAVSFVRVAKMDSADLPRLCVTAACRSLELLIETYHAAVTGRKPLSADDRATLRSTILLAAVDLKAILLDAGTITDTLMAYADKLAEPPPTPETLN